MDLYPTDSNPVPSDATVGEIAASDGAKLRYAHWRPTARRTLGTICLFQGRAESIERYFETIGDLRKRGFAVATFDWRGQGGSERRLRNPRKGHIDSFAEYDRDVDAFIQQVALPDCPPPHFALGHSAGGLMCLRAARDGRTRFTRMILDGPLLGLGNRHPSQGMVYSVAALVTAIGLGEMDVPSGKSTPIERMQFDNNPLTSDPDRFRRSVEIAQKLPQVSVGAPTYGWLYAACKAIAEASDPSFAPAINVPVLMVAGSLDRVVSVAAIEALAGELRAGSLVILPGARHEVLQERNTLREQYWAAFDAFIPGS